MNRELVDRIVGATLYEGYILYPYRPSSVKNQLRWTFGGVHPRAYSQATGGSDPWEVRTELLLRGAAEASVEVRVRFLHLVKRTVGVLRPGGAPDEIEPVPALRVGSRTYRAWQEAEECDLGAGRHAVSGLLQQPVRVPIEVAARRWAEPVGTADSGGAAAVVRAHGALHGEIEIAAEKAGEATVRVRVSVRNLTEVDPGTLDRERALLDSMVSTHAVLGVSGGRWLSLADPPADALEAAAACRNTGLWPVLVGEEDDTVLASPIILEDHPQVAPESPGDLYDATEIDEILSLRILTLSDDEKVEMRASDERARALLDRTEALTADDFMRMHGVTRTLPSPGPSPSEVRQ